MMKKILTVAVVAVCFIAFALPASALENEFGGYWRTRAYTQVNFTGEDDTEMKDVQLVDTRTRLYYTAIINDNLKLVNKFESDAEWGDTGRGRIGADDISLEIKNMYADFTIGQVNTKVGTQGWKVARGFLFDDDFSGLVVDIKGDAFDIPIVWVKAYEGYNKGTTPNRGKDQNDFDADYLSVAPSFTLDAVTLTPYYFGVFSGDVSKFITDFTKIGAPPATGTIDAEELSLHFLGIDVDAKIGESTVWFTGIYQMGKVDWQEASGGGDSDISGYCIDIGASIDLGMAGIHGEGFYMTGDDNDDEDIDAFLSLPGQTHYWAEIMGAGIFDGQVSNHGKMYNDVTNIMALNLGATIEPMDKLILKGDVWYAATAEDVAIAGGGEESDLGIEIDLVATYELVENMSLDVVAAYLIAGDLTTEKSDNDADPYELGLRLSLAF